MLQEWTMHRTLHTVTYCTCSVSVSYAVQCSLILVGEVFTFVCKWLCSFCPELAYILGRGGGGGGWSWSFLYKLQWFKIFICCLYFFNFSDHITTILMFSMSARARLPARGGGVWGMIQLAASFPGFQIWLGRWRFCNPHSLTTRD